MKKPYVAVIALYLIIFSLYAGNAIAEETGIISLPTIMDNTSEPELSTISFITKNGKTLEKGVENNPGNETSTASSIIIIGEIVPVKVTLEPGQFVQYGIIEDFFIVPHGHAVINEKETTYFSESQKLSINLTENKATGLTVIAPVGMKPVAVMSSKGFSWSFDAGTRAVTITPYRGVVGGKTQIYFGTLTPGIIFLEDTEKVETQRYKNSLLSKDLKDMSDVLVGKKSEKEEVNKNTSVLETQAQEMKLQIKEQNKEIEDISVSLVEITKLRKNNIILQNEILVVAILLLLVLLYMAFFRGDEQ